MKKEWVEPEILVQQFVANEYVAACGDKNKVYKFECNAPRGMLYYYPNSDGAIDGEHTVGGAKWLGGYEPCSKTHDASVNSDFRDGFVDYNWNQQHDDGEGVIVWIEYEKGWFGTHISDYHATKELNMDSWTTAKS